MTEKLDDVWTSRDYPVLVAAARRIDQGEPMVNPEQLVADTGLDRNEINLAGAALRRRKLVDATIASGGDVLALHHLSGEAYLLTGLHPDGDNAITQLINALRQVADQVTDPEEKSKLRRLADNASAVSRDVLAAVLATVITGGIAN
ncbi:MAG: hypothetical protein ACRCYX_15575 [Dermatophilaceae bacterium]